MVARLLFYGALAFGLTIAMGVMVFAFKQAVERIPCTTGVEICR